MKKIDWGTSLFIIGYHIGLLIGLPIYCIFYTPPLAIGIVSFILMYLSGLSITVGYHRYYAHTTYKTNKFIEVILLFFGSMATQGSALQWAYDHRLHHAHVDTDKDPYSIKKGFIFAHILWLFQKRSKPQKRIVADLYRNPLVLFQHRFYVPLMLITNIAPFLFFGWLFNDYLASFIFVWWVRLFVLHHFTWFINSLAHTWGSKNFSQEHSAVDNYVISLLTFGEGYHNYHHTFANDYRNGTKWYHFDPSKWIIWTLNCFGLARNLKRVKALRIKERILIERKRELLLQMKDYWFLRKNLLEEKVEKITDELITKLRKSRELVAEYHALKKESREKAKQIYQNLKVLKRGLKEDFRAWKKLSKGIMKLRPI